VSESVAEQLRRWHEPSFGRPHDLEDPHVSADGARVVVTGLVYDELVGKPRTAIYTGDLTPVTSGPSSARGGRLSPDGRTLAFLSDRRRPGVFGLHILGLADLSEAFAAPEVPGTVEYVRWSPDGRSILLGVAGVTADVAGRDGSGSYSAGDTEAWYPEVDEGVTDTDWRGLWLYSLDTARLSQLSPSGANCWEAAWCGPTAVLAVTSDDPGEDAWYHAAPTLFDVPAGGRHEILRSEVQLGLPTGSPDGRYAAVVQAICSDRGSVAGDLTIIDLTDGGRHVVDTAGADVTRVQWLGPARLGYVGERRLDVVAGLVDLTTGRTTELLSTAMSFGRGKPNGAFTDDGRVVVARSAYRRPPEIAVLGGERDEVLASTVGAGTDYLLFIAGTAEPVTWSAPDGLEIDGILCTPPGDGPFPLVVNIHGGPVTALRDEWSMRHAWVPLLVARGYAVLNPNARGSSGRGQKFARLVVADMGGADTHDHLSGIDALVERGVADPARLGLIGGSYGGFMSSWLVTQDQRFAAAVPIAPVTDWTSKSFTSNIGGWARDFLAADPEQPGSRMHTRSPVLHASKVRTPCLIVAGAQDRCTPPGQAREFHQALQAHGVESVLVTYPQEGHGVRAHPALTDVITRISDWFARHMPAA
jgi:dipeptidyl aminopeptidase/acylaminoacyl peptidase